MTYLQGINNAITNREYESFAEKGLSEKRQMLRYEHYEEKRHLKLRAIQNVLLKCQQKDGSGEALQVQSLLEDLKRQKNQGLQKKTFYSPFKNSKHNTSIEHIEDSSPDRLVNQSYIESQAAKQMERVQGKLERWNKTKEMIEKRKSSIEHKAQQILNKEKKKFDKIEENQKEYMEDLKIKLEYQKKKWLEKVNGQREFEKKEEQAKYLRSKDIISETRRFFENKSKREKSLFEKVSKPNLTYYNSEYVQQFSSRKINISDNEDQNIKSKLQLFEEKLKRAEERNQQKKLEIITKGQTKSQAIEQKRNDQFQREQQKYEEILSKTVMKAKRTQSKRESRMEEINRTAEKLQEIHKKKEERLRQQQEEERRNVQQQLRQLEMKTETKEKIIKQKKDSMLDQISAKKEKRRLQFEDKAENEKRLRIMQQTLKQQIFQKYNEKEQKILQMRQKWLNNSVLESNSTQRLL